MNRRKAPWCLGYAAGRDARMPCCAKRMWLATVNKLRSQEGIRWMRTRTSATLDS